MKTCSIEGCGRKHKALGLCGMHYQRQRGGRDLHWDNEESFTYNAVHLHLKAHYGPAPSCIWSDSHTGRMEWANVSGTYTKDIEDYLPMCASCHRKFDTTDDTRRKISLSNIGNHRAKRSPVAQYSGDKLITTYESLHDAARSTGIHVSQICGYLNGYRPTAGGFHWVRVESAA